MLLRGLDNSRPRLLNLQKSKNMACAQTLSGILNDCAPSMGGIVETYLGNFSDVSAVTVTSGKITGITLAASGSKFKKFTFPRNTGSMSSNQTIDETTGANFVATDLMLQFNRMETAKRIEIVALAQGELAAIVKDANGLYWYLGKDAPVKATAADGLTGTARADRNGYSVTLQDNSLEMPHEILVGTGGVDLSEIVD